jgi:CubicO group peptidase (beta-lactamase class C family)
MGAGDPHSDEVTLGQLAHMTSGYTDYVIGGNAADQVWREIAAVVAPEDPPPPRKP